MININQLTPFVRQYLETALWSSVDNDCNPLDQNYSLEDFSQEALEKACQDYEKFSESCLSVDGASDLDDSDLGHDFWLTRNHHGAGFWDGDYDDDLGDQLTEISEAMGSVDLYVGDDGKLYFS